MNKEYDMKTFKEFLVEDTTNGNSGRLTMEEIHKRAETTSRTRELS